MKFRNKVGVGIAAGALAFLPAEAGVEAMGLSERALEDNNRVEACTVKIGEYTAGKTIDIGECLTAKHAKNFRNALKVVDTAKESKTPELLRAASTAQTEYRRQTLKPQDAIDDLRGAETALVQLITLLGFIGGFQKAPDIRQRWQDRKR